MHCCLSCAYLLSDSLLGGQTLLSGSITLPVLSLQAGPTLSVQAAGQMGRELRQV